jgi:hypothetical protein
MHLVPAVGLEAKAEVFVVVHEWHQWLANKGEYVGCEFLPRRV